MAKYRKKHVVEAVQWFKDGDHPKVRMRGPYKELTPAGESLADLDWGWIDTLEGGYWVTPGDWIITGIKGECYACKPDIFAATYELVE